MSNLLLNLVLASPLGALALGVGALLVPCSRRRLALALSIVGSLWGLAGTLGFLLGARHFYLLHKAGKTTDYIFDTKMAARDTLIAAAVTFGITTLPLLVLRRNRGRPTGC